MQKYPEVQKSNPAQFPRKTYSSALFFFGSVSNALAYSSIEPIFAAMIFLGVGLVLLKFKGIGGDFERAMFVTVFSVCWFMAGIAGIYASYLHDPSQLYADSGNFFWISRSNIFAAMGLEELKVRTEGSLAVVIWRTVYNGFAFFGFEKGRYVGVLVNIFLVASTGVLSVKMAYKMYGNDAPRLNRLILYFSFCGIFWLFAVIHIRDAFVLFFVTLLVYFWTVYFEDSNFLNLIILIIISLFSFLSFSFLRTEFVFVPFAMLLAGLVSTFLYSGSKGPRNTIINITTIICFLIVVTLLPEIFIKLQAELSLETLKYSRYAKSAAASDSLGVSLILNQAYPVRLFLGIVWIYIFPVPVWSGFQLETVYHLLKSFHAIFMYFLIPLIFLSIRKVYLYQSLRSPVLIFNIFLVLGFSIAVSSTSFETRHIGAFFVPLLMVALLPDFNLEHERIAYKNLLTVFMSAIFFVHIAYVFLKFF